MHNLTFIARLMEDLRTAILEGRLARPSPRCAPAPPRGIDAPSVALANPDAVVDRAPAGSALVFSVTSCVSAFAEFSTLG